MKKHNEIGGWLLVMAYAFFLIALFAALSLLPKTAKGAPQVDSLSLGILRLPYQNDYFYPDKKYWGYHLKLNWDVSWGSFFWENQIDSRTANSRFRDVSWYYVQGINLFPGLDLVHIHRSQHALDYERQNFPVTDSYGIRINFVK